MRTPTSFGVGEVLFSSEFRIAPQDVAGWELAQMLGGRDDGPSFRPGLEQPPVASPVPEGLILARALEGIERSSSLAGCAMVPTSSSKLRSLAPVSVGERLTAVATIRYRSVREHEPHVFLTLAVEIRGAGRKVAEIDLGVEIHPLASSLAHAA
jgi:hypothetical protein